MTRVLFPSDCALCNFFIEGPILGSFERMMLESIFDGVYVSVKLGGIELFCSKKYGVPSAQNSLGMPQASLGKTGILHVKHTRRI